MVFFRPNLRHLVSWIFLTCPFCVNLFLINQYNHTPSCPKRGSHRQYEGFFLAGFKGRKPLFLVVVLTGAWPLWCYDHGAEDRSGGAQAPCVLCAHRRVQVVRTGRFSESSMFGWWFQICFYVYPKFEEMIQFDEYIFQLG